MRICQTVNKKRKKGSI